MSIHKKVIIVFVAIFLVPYLLTGLFLYHQLSQILGADIAWSFAKGLYFIGAILLVLDLIVSLFLANDLSKHLFYAQEEAEQKIKLQEEKFRVFFQTSPQAIALLNYDGKVLDANDRYLDSLGLTKDQVVGLSKVVGLEKNIFFGLTEKELENVLVSDQSLNFDKNFIKNDGANKTVHLTTSKVIGPHSEPYGTAIVVADLSISKQTAVSLQNELDLKTALLSSLGQAIIAVDSQDKILLFNNKAEHLLGFFASEVIGKKYTEVIGGSNNIPFQKTISANQIVSQSCVLQKKNKSPITPSVVVSPVVINGEKSAAIAILTEAN